MQQTSNIGYMLQHLAAVLARQSDQALQDALGIGFSQFKILMVLRQDPHVQQRFIADSLGQTEASVSRQIKLLQRKGLLKVTPNPQNKRVHITAPTERGDRLADEAVTILNRLHYPTFSRLSETEQQQLAGILRQLHEAACSSSHPWGA